MVREILILFGVIFTLVALIVRFAGNNAVLAGSANGKIKDMAKLNKWAGNRFALLPAIAFGFAPFSIDNAAIGILGCMLLLFATFGVIIWISIGSRKFQTDQC